MIFDLNIINAISSGFGYYRTRETDFNALFNGVNESVLSAWFAELNTHFPAFRTRNSRGVDEAPMLVVSPLSENVTQTMIGDYDSRNANGVGIDSYLVRETVEIMILAKSPDMVRVYQVLTRASIAIARRPLHSAGYHLVEYGGSDALTPEEELSAEELGLFVRRLTVSGDHRVSIPIPPASEFTVPVYSGSDIVVLTADQESDDGIKGGVVVDV